MKTRHLSKLLLTFLLPVLLLTGCWEEDLPNQEQDTLFPLVDEPAEEEDASLPKLFALPYVPEQTMDPITCADGMQQVVGSLLYEGLFHLDHELEPQPLLCSSYSYDPDALTYTFQLRPDVQFSDGTPLTGQDVRDTLNRARSSPRYSARLAQVTRIIAAEQTVTVTLSAPNTRFPALLDVPIVKSGTEGGFAPVGTGPYLLTSDQAIPQLVASQLWWQGDQQPVDRITLVEASDLDTMIYRFTSNDVQLITADLLGKNTVSAAGDIAFQDVDTTILHYLGCNTQRAPLNDPALRRVLSQGFSRETIISAFLSGHGKPAQFPLAPASTLYPQELEQRYSKDAFLIAAQEHSVRRALTLVVNSENPFKVSVADYIAKSLTEGGIPVVVKALPWENYVNSLISGNFDLYYGEVRLSADWNLSPLLLTGGTLNYGGWTDPTTDQLLSAYAAAQDPAAAMEALCRHLQQQAPIVPICFTSQSVLTHPEVLDGLAPTAAEPFYDLPSCKIHLQPAEE